MNALYSQPKLCVDRTRNALIREAVTLVPVRRATSVTEATANVSIISIIALGRITGIEILSGITLHVFKTNASFQRPLNYISDTL